MRNYADQDYLHARIYAMRGRLLFLRDYASMVREPQTFALKLSDAHDLIEARETLFHEQIAPVIRLVEAYDKYIPIFIAYLRQFEIHNVKILLARASGLESLEQWYDIGPFAILGKELLRKNLSVGEIKSLVANTYLADALQDISSYLYMEINLDITAVRNIYNSSALLSSQAQKDFQDMLVRRTAVLNVVWSCRIKAYYHLNDENVRLYMEKFNKVFGGHMNSQVRVVEEALNQYIEKLRKSGGQEPSAVDIEQHLEQDYYTWISSMFHRDFHSICGVIAYLWLLFYQIKNLLRIIDGRRFGFSAEAILNKIICAERD